MAEDLCNLILTFKDLLMAITKSDLLDVTIAVIHVARNDFWQYEKVSTKEGISEPRVLGPFLNQICP